MTHFQGNFQDKAKAAFIVTFLPQSFPVVGQGWLITAETEATTACDKDNCVMRIRRTAAAYTEKQVSTQRESTPNLRNRDDWSDGLCAEQHRGISVLQKTKGTWRNTTKTVKYSTPNRTLCNSAVFDTSMYRHRDLRLYSMDTAGPVSILWHVCSSGPKCTSFEHRFKMFKLAAEEHYWVAWYKDPVAQW